MKYFQSLSILLLLVVIVFIPNGIPAQVEYIDQARKDIAYLASDRLKGRGVGTRGEYKAAKYIRKRFRKLGLEPMGTDGYYQAFSVLKSDNPHNIRYVEGAGESITGRNIIGYIDHGARHTVIIGAHYDHLGMGDFGSLYIGDPVVHNGADDNASGVAGLLYLADILRTRYTGSNYLLIAFSGEERGLWGSNYFTKHPTIDLGTVDYMLNMDMIGRLNAEKKLAVNAVGTSPQWDPVLEHIQVDDIQIVTSEGGIGASDHTSFYLQEIPVLHFFTGQHEDYHKPTDDADKINYAGMISVLNYIEAVIAELDDDPKITYRETREADQKSRPAFKVTLGVMPDYLFDGKGMRIDGVRPDRPASRAGLEKGDIVLQMGDLMIEGMEGYMEALSKFNPGETVTVIVKRGERKIEKKVTF